jgi:flagellar motor switch protein FliN/FliY
MPADLRSILSLEVPIIVLLGERKMTTAEVVSLIPGSIIELTKKVDEELTLLVNNRPLATGTAVKVGENFGLRLSVVGDLKDRIQAMGGAAAEAEAGASDEDVSALADAMLAGNA